jgi:hypothetical protein
MARSGAPFLMASLHREITLSAAFPSRKAEEAYNFLICGHEIGVTGLC